MTWIMVPVSTVLPQGQRVLASSQPTTSSCSSEWAKLLDPPILLLLLTADAKSGATDLCTFLHHIPRPHKSLMNWLLLVGTQICNNRTGTFKTGRASFSSLSLDRPPWLHSHHLPSMTITCNPERICQQVEILRFLNQMHTYKTQTCTYH
jgi:hypothetical protein